MMREDTVFGPIFSRRLGSSLGINLLPRNGKLCNFDCIYCECGWNKDGTGDRELPTANDVRIALESKLRECLQAGTPIDSIDFYWENPQIITDTVVLRDEFYPKAKVSVLSNATRLSRDSVVEALRKVDNPILKLDAPTAELAYLINQPVGEYNVEDVVRGMEKFGGDFVMQTMFLRSPGFDTSSPEVLLPWMDIVRRVHPREIMVYTIDRPTPAAGLQKFSEAEMRVLVQPLIDEGYNIQIKG